MMVYAMITEFLDCPEYAVQFFYEKEKRFRESFDEDARLLGVRVELVKDSLAEKMMTKYEKRAAKDAKRKRSNRKDREDEAGGG